MSVAVSVAVSVLPRSISFDSKLWKRSVSISSCPAGNPARGPQFTTCLPPTVGYLSRRKRIPKNSNGRLAVETDANALFPDRFDRSVARSNFGPIGAMLDFHFQGHDKLGRRFHLLADARLEFLSFLRRYFKDQLVMDLQQHLRPNAPGWP